VYAITLEHEEDGEWLTVRLWDNADGVDEHHEHAHTRSGGETTESLMSQDDTFDLIAKRVVALMEQEEVPDRYPNRTHFIAADHPDHEQMTGEALAEDATVILFVPDGNEVLIEPGENGTAARAQARDLDGQPFAA
jgi:hypothetical protein